MKKFQLKRALPLATLFMLLPWATRAQGWPEPSGSGITYDDVRRHFLGAWHDSVPPPGSGYSVFKRWEWYWSTRLRPDGTLPPANVNAVEWQRYREKHPGAAESAAAGWTSLGPASSNSGYYGLGRVNCLAFHPANAATWWAGTPAGGLWKTTNGGTNWVPLTDGLPVLGVSAIAVDPSNTNTLYIGTGDKNGGHTYSLGVLKTTDGGTTWTATGLSFGAGQYKKVYQLILHPANPSVLLAATSDGLYRTADGGATWTATLPIETVDIVFRPGSPGTVYAATATQIFRSTDGGLTWTSQYTIANSTRIALAVTPANPAVLAAVSTSGGPYNGLYWSADSGQSFTLRSSSPNLLNNSPTGTGGGGQGWYDLCIAISPVNAETVYLGGINLWLSTNSGLTWSLVNYWASAGAPIGVAVVHADKHFLGWRDNNTLFQGNDGGVYFSTNGGSTWTDVSNSLVISQLYRAGVSQSSPAVIAGLQDNGTKLRAAAGTWTDHIGGDGMDCAIHPSNASVLYGSLQRGALRRSLNGGASWANIQQYIPGNPTGAWVTPIALAANGTLYAGYNDVFRTANQGTTWTALSAGLSAEKLTLLAVAPSDNNVVYAGTVDSLWRTTNGGGTWTIITGDLPAGAITAITVDPADASRIYATLGGYVAGQKVFRSTTGGGSWTNFSGSLPNLPANCVVYQSGSNEALYVGMDVGVFYRNAAMSDWMLYNAGLPNVPVVDLELNVSSNTLVAATFGRGLWQSPAQPPGFVPDQLAVTPANQNAGSGAGSTTFAVTANIAWAAASDQPWLTVAPVAGVDNGTLTATVAVNPAPQPRTAYVTVTGGGLQRTVSVTQAGATASGCPDDQEPGNNVRSTAPVLEAGTARYARIGSAGDFDYWKIVLATPQDILVSLTGLPADYDLQLFRADGLPLASSNNGGLTDELLALPLPAGVYYALVSPWGAVSATSCYTLLVVTGQ